MIRKKICMLGAPEVGKSSLVRRFVHSLFSDVYHSTIGVKIERKTMTLPSGQELSMIIWDVHGEAGPLSVPDRYLRGVHGLFFVVDASRPETARTGCELLDRVNAAGPVPYVVAWNKADLVDPDTVDVGEHGALLATSAVATIWTSAKTGDHVDDAFVALADAIV